MTSRFSRRSMLLPALALGFAATAPSQLWAKSKKAPKGLEEAAAATTEAAAPVEHIPADGMPPRPDIIDRCETCHGIDGNSLHFDFPKLAGQQRDYLLKQMKDIKAGERKVDVMVPILSLLSDEQMVALADYFAAVPLVKGTSANPGKAKIGKKIFDLGVPYRMVAQCSACHGTYAEGRSDPGLVRDGFGGFPALNGQHAVYTEKQLKEFRSGVRNNDFNDMMHNLAKHMSDQEISLVAEYLSGMDLPPETFAETVMNTPAPPQVAACMGCHGPQGNSFSPAFPKLAGQQQGYVIKQLTDMKSGKRKVPMMGGAIATLTPEDIEVIADYYAAQTPATTPSGASEEEIAAGMQIFFEGTDKVLACYSCHNFDGMGTEDFGLSPGGYPMLFGQHSGYLVKQLTDFKNEDRKNDHISAMHNIAREMTDEEIKLVSVFLQEMKF